MQENKAVELPRTVASRTEASAGPEVQDRLDKLASALERYQQANHVVGVRSQSKNS
jgi:hypothetical protein